jgi:hypothetical protein
MDNINESETKNIEINNKTITITYNNNSTEILELNEQTYKDLYSKWFDDNIVKPIYIDLELKETIDNLKVLTNESDSSKIAKLDSYFMNSDNIKNFIKYTRDRIKDVIIENNIIKINRWNSVKKEVELNENGLKELFVENFTGENKGMFLSDKHKTIIKALNFIKIDKNKDNNMTFIKNEFENKDTIMKFFEYLNRRPFIMEKELTKWKKNT